MRQRGGTRSSRPPGRGSAGATARRPWA